MQQENQRAEGSRFELWMVANLAVGMGQFVFVPMLVVPYVTSVTGSAADGGIVLAIIGLSALSAPLVAGFADKYHAHRLMFTLGMLAMAVSYALYAWSASNQEVYALVAIIFGVGIAGIQSMGPAFILSVGISQGLQARRLAFYNLLTSVGILVGGLLLSIVGSWSFSQKFLLASGIITLLAVIVWFATAKPAQNIRPRQIPSTESAEGRKEPTAIGQVLHTTFGVLLLMAVFAGMGYNAFIGQIGNIMGHTFAFEPATTSLLLGVSGLINMAGFLLAGFWMARSGGLPVATGAQIMHLTGLVGLALLSLISPPVSLLAGLFMLVFYTGEPFGRIPQAVLAVRFSTLPTSTATGWYIAVLAGSASIGSLLAGVLAQAFGYSAIIWMSAVAFAIGLLVNVFWLWPAERKKRAEEAQEGEVSKGAGTPAPG